MEPEGHYGVAETGMETEIIVPRPKRSRTTTPSRDNPGIRKREDDTVERGREAAARDATRGSSRIDPSQGIARAPGPVLHSSRTHDRISTYIVISPDPYFARAVEYIVERGHASRRCEDLLNAIFVHDVRLHVLDVGVLESAGSTASDISGSQQCRR